VKAGRVAPAVAILLALLAAAVALVLVELGKGAAGAGSGTVANPCRPRPPLSGHGIDATIQRIVLDGLDGAACQLGTTREQLVLSFGGGAGGPKLRWDRHTIEVALRAGLLRAVDEAERRGDVPSFLAPVLRRVIENVPLDRLIQGGITLSDLIG
jgi:hypothetical protein